MYILLLGPGSSETDDNELGVVEEVELVANGNLATPIHKLVVEEEEEETSEMSARIVHKTTPPSVSRSSPTTYSNRPPSSITSKATPTTGRGTQIGGNSVSKTRPPLGGKRQVGGTKVFDKESNNESQTSDTEMTSTSALSLSSQKGTGAGAGRRKFDSDLSTAPFSSETSDMSEGERGLGRKGSPPPNPPSSSISRISPKQSRKAISVDVTQTDIKAEATPSKVEATPTAKGSARPVRAGNFVSKRTSVLAMISQFDGGPTGGPNKKPDNEGTGSARVPPARPHPPLKSAVSAKPNPRPKPPGITNKQASPPRATPTKTTSTADAGNEEKKAEKPNKTLNTRISSVAAGGRTKSSTDCTSGDSSSSHNEGGVVSGRSSGGSSSKLSTSKAPATKSGSTLGTTNSKGSDTLKSLKGDGTDAKSDTKSVASNDSDETKSANGSVGGASKQVGGANKPARPVPPRGIKRSTTTATNSTNRLSAIKTTPTSGRSSPVSLSNVGGASVGAKLKGTDDIQLLGNKVKPNGGAGGGVGGVKRTRPSLSSRTGSSDKSTTPTLTKNSISLPIVNSKESLGSKSPPVPVERKSPPTPVEKKVLPTPADKKLPPTPTEKTPPTPSTRKPPPTPVDKKPPIIERKNPLVSKLSADGKSPPIEKKATPTLDKKVEGPLDKDESATKELLEKRHSIKRPSPRRPPPEPPTLSPPPAPKSPSPVFRKVSPPTTNKSSVAPPLPPPPKSISPKATPPTPPAQRALPPTPVGQKPSLQKATPPSQKAPPRPPKLGDSKDQAQNYEEFVPTLHRSASMSSQTGLSSPIPLSPNESHYEGVSMTPAFTIGNIKKSNQSSDTETPPPLPPRNYIPDDNVIMSLPSTVISLPAALTTVDERDGPTTPTSVGPFPSLDDAPPPLPTQPIPKRKSFISHMPSPPSCSPLLKRKEIPASLIRTSPTLPSRVTPPSNRINIYEEINIGPSPFRSRSNSASSSLRTMEQHYEVSDSYRPNESPKTKAGLVRTSSSGELLLIVTLLLLIVTSTINSNIDTINSNIDTVNSNVCY